MTHPPYAAVRNLLATFCELMDSGELDALGSLFADAVLLGPDGAELARGTAESTLFFSRRLRLYDGSPRTRHVLSSPVIHVDGDMATSRTPYLVVQQVGPERVEIVAAGRFRDTFSCTGGEWRFAARQFFLDQTGDLEMHVVGR